MVGSGNGSGTGNGKANGSARQPITVLIVDDERTFGEALEVALEREKDLRVIHVATGGSEAVAAAGEQHPDVVLMDASMPDMSGIEATRRIKEADPEAAVVILSGHDDDYLLARAVQAGASGMLRKTEAVLDVASTVRRAHRGEAIHNEVEVELAQRRLRHRRDLDDDARARLDRLTPRELEILSLMAVGRSPDEIATSLAMSPNTLRTHTQNVLTKLRVHSKMEALVLAIRHGKVTTVDLPEAG
ncbi:MAG TPA: response regulator transcription factor [Actinomycetota bacterium]|nr:response regulator transcription factor [Actinomycetota bacterium]